MVGGTASNLLILGLIVGVGLALLVPFVLISTRGLAITIDNLKDSYGPGENITFTINAEGVLEKQCNYHAFPEVEIQHLQTTQSFIQIVCQSQTALSNIIVC